MRRRSTAIAGATLLALALSTLTTQAANAAEPTHTIAQVQGTGAATPLSGTTVTIEGVVTGDYRSTTASGVTSMPS
jgi:5'-nucleotidase